LEDFFSPGPRIPPPSLPLDFSMTSPQRPNTTGHQRAGRMPSLLFFFFFRFNVLSCPFQPHCSDPPSSPSPSSHLFYFKVATLQQSQKCQHKQKTKAKTECLIHNDFFFFHFFFFSIITTSAKQTKLSQSTFPFITTLVLS